MPVVNLLNSNWDKGKYGYSKILSNTLFTTKSTKDTKREDPLFLSFLRALRVLRGDNFTIEFNWSFLNKHERDLLK